MRRTWRRRAPVAGTTPPAPRCGRQLPAGPRGRPRCRAACDGRTSPSSSARCRARPHPRNGGCRRQANAACSRDEQRLEEERQVEVELLDLAPRLPDDARPPPRRRSPRGRGVLAELGEPVGVDDGRLGAGGDHDEVAVPRGERRRATPGPPPAPRRTPRAGRAARPPATGGRARRRAPARGVAPRRRARVRRRGSRRRPR